MRWIFISLLSLAFLSNAAYATQEEDGSSSKDQGKPGIVMLWPNQESAILKLTFSRFQNLATYAGKMTLVSNELFRTFSPS